MLGSGQNAFNETVALLQICVGPGVTSDYDLIISEHVLEEVPRVPGNRSIGVKRIPPQRSFATTWTLSRTFAEVVPITDFGSAASLSHPEDDFVLATAVSGDAEYLVTGDKQFLALDAYQSVRSVSPREFLDVLDRQKLGG